MTSYIPFDKTAKDNVYRLTDEYSLFYLKFIEKARSTGEGTWLKLSEKPSWKSWSGVVFESVCIKHLYQIKKALGIQGVFTEESVWRYAPHEGEGAQIDLLIDRSDHCINICEMKYTHSEFSVDKSYDAVLRQKQQVFKEKTKTKKTLFLTLITTYGVKKNSHYAGLIQSEIVMDELFA